MSENNNSTSDFHILLYFSWILVGNDDELDCGAPQKAQPENVGSAAPCSSVAVRVCSKSFGFKNYLEAATKSKFSIYP